MSTLDDLGAPAWRVETSSETETFELGAALAGMLDAGDWISLVGDLGSGKTVLVRGMGKTWQCEDVVRSPTFSLIQTYRPQGKTYRVHHVDLYRLGGGADMAGLGWDELCSSKDVVVVEWAEKASCYWPGNCLVLRFEHLGEDKRAIQFHALGRRPADIVKALKGRQLETVGS